MPSLSDSQNLDLGPNGEGGGPTLPQNSPLQACPGCEALLDISDREPLEKIACPQCGTEMLVKGEIAHYVITEVAGRGGMGVVYKAYDSSLDRNVAIKLLRKDQSADTKTVQQLETEAAITASVTDPNVVRVFGTGTDRGRLYIVMELVDKGSLDTLIQLQGRVAEAQVLQVGAQVARGLRAAQQHGLIHRDVKPGNILFADAQTAKIVDFGLAVFQEQEESVRGEIWGTPYYVAPEKLDQQPEDFRSDMYSLGGTLFHALAGRPPFEAENASLVALKHLKSQQVSLQSFAPWVSNRTAHIINQMLNKDPAKRFQSYEELIESLEYALTQLHAQGGTNTARNRVSLETSEEDQKRYTWVFLGLAAAVLILGVVFGLSLWKKNAPPPKPVARAAVRTGARYEPLQPGIEALAAGKPEAVELFTKAAENPVLSPADRAWARLFTGAAQLAIGKTNEARNSMNQVSDVAALVKDQAMGELIGDIGRRTADTRPVPTTLTERLDPSGHEAAALFVYALHNWRLSKTDDAMAMFKQFRAAEPRGTAEWISQFKALAIVFIEKETAYQVGVARLKAATSPSERWSASDALKKVDAAFAKRADEAIAPFKAEIDKHRAEISKPPTSGIYRIASRMHGRVLDVAGRSSADGTHVQLYDGAGSLNQWWRVIPTDGGKVKFKAMHSGKMLALAANGKIVQTENNYDLTQQWRIESKGDGNFKIRNESNGKILAVQDDKRDNSVPATLRDDGDKGEWQWKFDRQAVELGEYYGTHVGGTQRGSFELKDNVFTITNASRDIWGTGDHFAFAWRKVNQDFELVARVIAVTNPQSATKVGLVIRTGVAGGDANVAVLTMGTTGGNPPKVTQNAINYQQRLKGGTGATETRFSNLPLPRWLKLVRTGDTVTTFHSADGAAWTQAGTSTIAGLRANSYVGLAVTSRSESQVVTAKFDNVKLTPTAK